VSWSSAFCGLFSIAATLIIQPAGRVCDAPRDVSVWIRVSPIICFLDVSNIICRLVYYTIDKRSLKAARRMVIAQRYGSDDKHAHHATTSLDAKKGRYSPRMACWIWYLLPVPQVINIFAVEGVAWTKLWAAMYIASFLAVELITLPSKHTTVPKSVHKPKDTPDMEQQPESLMLYVSLAAGIVFASYFAIEAMVSVLSQYCQDLMILDKNLVMLEWVRFSLIIIGSTGFYIAALYLQYTIQPCTTSSSRQLDPALGQLFFLFHLITAYMFYCFSYDV
jgi:hypothetical protein